MTIYFPDEIFNIIKEYCDIDPIKHNQKKLKNINISHIEEVKMGVSQTDMEEARILKSKLRSFDDWNDGCVGFEETLRYSINDDMYEQGDAPFPLPFLDYVIFRNYAECDSDDCEDYEIDWEYAVGEFPPYE